MTEYERVLTRALLSLLDVVEELCQGLAHKAEPTPEWAAVVAGSCALHRREIQTGEVTVE